jgi:hypothetical protein
VQIFLKFGKIPKNKADPEESALFHNLLKYFYFRLFLLENLTEKLGEESGLDTEEDTNADSCSCCNRAGNDTNDSTGGETFELSDYFSFNCTTDGASTLSFAFFLLGSFFGGYPFAEGTFGKLGATGITVVIAVVICAFGNLGAANVTVVVVVAVCTRSQYSAANVALVVVVVVCASGEFSTASVALVVVVVVCTSAHGSTADVTLVVVVSVRASGYDSAAGITLAVGVGIGMLGAFGDKIYAAHVAFFVFIKISVLGTFGRGLFRARGKRRRCAEDKRRAENY